MLVITKDYFWVKPDGRKVRAVPFERIKNLFEQYPSPSSLSLPYDAYTNTKYDTFDENYCINLKKEGYSVYWSNVRDEHLNTSTPFMVLYIDQYNDVIPILIVAPPSFIVIDNLRNKTKLTKKERRSLKLRKNLGL